MCADLPAVESVLGQISIDIGLDVNNSTAGRCILIQTLPMQIHVSNIALMRWRLHNNPKAYVGWGLRAMTSI